MDTFYKKRVAAANISGLAPGQLLFGAPDGSIAQDTTLNFDTNILQAPDASINGTVNTDHLITSTASTDSLDVNGISDFHNTMTAHAGLVADAASIDALTVNNSNNIPVYEQLHWGAATVSNSANNFLIPEAVNNLGASATEIFLTVRIPAGKTGTISKLKAYSLGAPATQKSTISFFKRTPGAGGAGASAATTVTCDIAATATEGHDDTHSFTVVDGDEISCLHTPTAGQTVAPTKLDVCALLTIQ